MLNFMLPSIRKTFATKQHMLFHSLIFLLIISNIQLQLLLASAELDARSGLPDP